LVLLGVENRGIAHGENDFVATTKRKPELLWKQFQLLQQHEWLQQFTIVTISLAPGWSGASENLPP